MPSELDATALQRLRGVVQRLDAANASGTSLAEVVRLVRDLRVTSGLTVDFGATRELGQPMVVVRVPSAAVVPSSTLNMLSPREREVAALVASGAANKEIARILGLTLGTVKHYVHQILDKTGLPGRVAIAQAHREAMASHAEAPSILR
jgi:DNA-binding NarL/FixJ family response regulator